MCVFCTFEYILVDKSELLALTKDIGKDLKYDFVLSENWVGLVLDINERIQSLISNWYTKLVFPLFQVVFALQALTPIRFLFFIHRRAIAASKTYGATLAPKTFSSSKHVPATVTEKTIAKK